ncbi:MAG TPA: hypothetical protein VG367_17155 [Mucilaginibacter sp.]|jgi:hypothetical protein|nr:hypothetical protein [Mucilaginibacter sp.]
MKAIYLKRSLWLAAILLTSLYAGAQTKTASKTAYDSESNNMYYRTYTEGGHKIVHVKTEFEDKVYRVEMTDEKLTSLYVSGEKIPESDWNKYSDVIGRIREEMKEQEKRDAEQAVRNQEQAKRNAEQAVRNQDQAKRNAEQVIRNQAQAKRNEEQARLNADQQKRDAEQVVRNQEQEKKNAGQVVRNQEQAKLNADQAVRNQEQEKRNAEQAVRNQEQAKRNAEQAKANAQFMKDITEDFVNDKIIPDADGLHEMKINEFGMSVNGVRQPEDVFKKYKEKYGKFFEGNYNYSRDGIIRGQ